MKKTASQIADEVLRKVAAGAPKAPGSSFVAPQKGFGPTSSTKKNKWQDPARTGTKLKPPSVTNINAVTVG